MNVKKVVLELIESRGITKRKVETDTGIANGAIGKWDDSTLPDSKTLVSLADYFGVSIDFLLSREENKNLVFLSDNEKELFRIYRSVTTEGQKAMANYALFTMNEGGYKKESNIETA